jgi:hypothetical protein
MKSELVTDAIAAALAAGLKPDAEIHGFRDLDAMIRAREQRVAAEQARANARVVDLYNTVARAADPDDPTGTAPNKKAKALAARATNAEITKVFGERVRAIASSPTGSVRIATTPTGSVLGYETIPEGNKIIEQAKNALNLAIDSLLDTMNRGGVPLYGFAMRAIGLEKYATENPGASHNNFRTSDFPDSGMGLFRAVFDQIASNFPQVYANIVSNIYRDASSPPDKRIAAHCIHTWPVGTRQIADHESASEIVAARFWYGTWTANDVRKLKQSIDVYTAKRTPEETIFYTGIARRIAWVLDAYASSPGSKMEVPTQTTVGQRASDRPEWMDSS